MIRVLLLSKFERMGASSRMRSLQYLPLLESSKLKVVASPLICDEMLRNRYKYGGYSLPSLFKAYLGRWIALMSRGRFDLIWIEKEALPWAPLWVEMLLLRNVPYVLDYDDAIFHNYDRHRFGWVRKVFGRRLDGLMARARLVIGGNEYLAQRARDAGAPWVEVIPSVVDLRRYEIKQDVGEGRVGRIVWIGSPSTARYLRELAEPLAALAKSTPFTLHVIGANLEMKGVNLKCLPWSEATEAVAIAECDVGIMPLSDSPWERGKCGYKLVQYMACGLPVVASLVGANIQLVHQGVNGWLANTP
ncbi:MAG: glycosyltransferase, partial [Polaromonas sp.]|nr:glycosyltransferase [Polaromonas sp.]